MAKSATLLLIQMSFLFNFSFSFIKKHVTSRVLLVLGCLLHLREANELD